MSIPWKTIVVCGLAVAIFIFPAMSRNAGGNRVVAQAGIASLPTGKATFKWSMPERFGQMKNGIVDYHWDRVTHLYDPKFINPATWTVDFNACDSFGGPGNVAAYQWEILGGTYVTQACRFSYDKFRFLGTYPIKLTVTAKDGQVSSYEEVINVRDIVVVSIGDSFASGQGNPDVRRDKAAKTKAQWIYSRCHRSAKAAPALAARRIEDADPHSSVTFVSYACSGAEIDELVDDEQKKGIKKVESQIDMVRRAVIGRTVDALIISIGGNDAQFANLVTRAIAMKHADQSKRTQKIFDEGLNTLDASYLELRDAIARIPGWPKVFITEYPDLVRDADGQFCHEAPEDDKLLRRITRDEAKWASETVITNLNCKVRKAAGAYGWTYVDGIEWNFLKHGYCSGKNRWVNTFVDAREIQGTSRCRETGLGDCIVSPGSVHPNEQGHKCFATRIILSLQASGVVTTPNIITADDLCSSTPNPLPVRQCRLEPNEPL